MKSTDRLRRENEAYRKANPWYIQNLQNPNALCGRYPSLEAAKEAAASYGGVIGVQGHAVLVSQTPSL